MTNHEFLTKHLKSLAESKQRIADANEKLYKQYEFQKKLLEGEMNIVECRYVYLVELIQDSLRESEPEDPRDQD